MRIAKSTERESYHHGDLAAALTSAALKLIARHGVEGFSIREAAALVGVSPSAAYRHFADKADLLAAVTRQGFTQLAAETEGAMSAARNRHRSAAKKAVAAFEAQGLAYVNFAVNNPEQFQAMFGRHGAGSQQPVHNVCRADQSPYELLKRVLDELLLTKVVTLATRKDAELLAWSTLHGLANIMLSHSLVNYDSVNVNQATLGIVRRLLHGLRAN